VHTPVTAPACEQLRLAELLAALSLGVDLGFAQPMEHVLRQCVIALRLADRIGLGDADRATVYYAALLVNVGCHSDAHEQAKWFGDDIALKATKYRYDQRSLRGAVAAMRLIGAGNTPLHRVRVGAEFFLGGFREVDDMIDRHAELARRFAEELGLPQQVRDAVAASYERWDGKGWPGVLQGEAIPIAARLSQLAEFVEVAHRLGGPSAAAELARRRAGTQFDPRLAQLVSANSEGLFADLDSGRTWRSVVDAEPALARTLTGDAVDAALLAVADFVDLKSTYTLGHSRAVAELAATAATALGLPQPSVATVRRAALVHDLGRLGVSNAVWDKPGPLGVGEWERIRMQPYLTERILNQSTSLAPLAAIAVQHRERLDGSGYPRGLTGAAISVPARVLATADAYQCWREPRPHRAAMSLDYAASRLRAEAATGRFDAEVTEAVLEAAGHRPRRRVLAGPAGLTPREVEVLRMVARGFSSRQIADRLVVSPKTVRNHIEHIYAKVGAANRAAASLYAVQQGLLPVD
jgi:HD-GYP domain-containing protein (c-di-GMP phosphodiesterase class II)